MSIGNSTKLSKSRMYSSKTLIIAGIIVAVSITASIGDYSAISGNNGGGGRENSVGKELRLLILILRLFAIGMIFVGWDYFHQER